MNKRDYKRWALFQLWIEILRVIGDPKKVRATITGCLGTRANGTAGARFCLFLEKKKERPVGRFTQVRTPGPCGSPSARNK